MPPFRDWLARVLADGESVQNGPPALPAADRPAVLADLRAAFDRHALDIAGASVGFDPAAALGSAVVLAGACWRLVGGDGNDAWPGDVGVAPTSPAAHLSADVTLRFLPAVFRRAKYQNPAGPLASDLEGILRAWPLSGVLADLDGEPTTPPGFDDHPGLQLLYAERLAAAGRAGWVPPPGPGRVWVDRVCRERGPPPPAPPEEAPRD